MTAARNPGASPRARRSALYMPGANTRAMEKAQFLHADVLILDLEDAVAPEAKLTARRNVTKALRPGHYGHREVVVRINSLQSPWGHDDLAAIATLGADAVLLPKVESAEQIQDLAALMYRAGAPLRTRIWAMIETPVAMFNLREIAASHSLLETLVVGTSDLVKDLHARHTAGRHEVHTALSLCILAARSYQLSILDGVHLSLNDESGLRSACEQGRDMGFDGKTLIHPSQLAVANEVYGPSSIEIGEARRRIEAYEAAVLAGSGLTVLDGKLVEELHVQDAKRILNLAHAIDVLEEPLGQAVKADDG
ncbi:HpcH/HpaI aldolase/citrate lyase family protein [Variovorax ginsengisoli]|uniref:CoA ester lyase n=1 Tax=Variovorax ginsengisoli TaxID=363844 RepID=A0ABT8S8K2_9BURK|nr:CoA ester lyase [Variovorax ginsengisoli]MDN8615643.1 CoA ester lyase [Variovorax ginsengisoli]MDO1534813.1 CoA ester lyase [Variovorax ginsengisoli]